jgi:hypothetical protein
MQQSVIFAPSSSILRNHARAKKVGVGLVDFPILMFERGS